MSRSPKMPSKKLQDEVAAWLEFYRELGIEEFLLEPRETIEVSTCEPVASPVSVEPEAAKEEEPALSFDSRSVTAVSRPPTAARSMSLFETEAPRKVERETLEEIRADLGDCRRCKLAPTRKTIVFGQGNPHDELVFVGEGPGADEDEQGLPFVGRAGKLLNRMLQMT